MLQAKFSSSQLEKAAGAAALFLLLATVGAAAQDAAPSNANATRISARGSESGQQTILREIDDPASGAQWLLMTDPEHPGGPGRMVLAGNRSEPVSSVSAKKQELPVIHMGDAVILEEHTRVMDARLEANAMGTARKGAALQVRLKVTGTVVKAIALAPGRAEFAPEMEMRP